MELPRKDTVEDPGNDIRNESVEDSGYQIRYDIVEDPRHDIRNNSVEDLGNEIRKDIDEMEVDSEEVVGYQGDIWDSSDDNLYVAYDTSEMVVEADQMERA